MHRLLQCANCLQIENGIGDVLEDLASLAPIRGGQLCLANQARADILGFLRDQAQLFVSLVASLCLEVVVDQP